MQNPLSRHYIGLICVCVSSTKHLIKTKIFILYTFFLLLIIHVSLIIHTLYLINSLSDEIKRSTSTNETKHLTIKNEWRVTQHKR
jgi:ABC-type lipoprotein release transport system permease subunit